MKALLFVLGLAVSISMAEYPTAMGDYISSGSTWPGSEGETIFWSQLPTGSAIGSQYFPDLYPEYDAGVADDFEFAVSTTINKIRWWGGYWNSISLYPVTSPVEIYLYLDDSTTGNAQHFPSIHQLSPAG